MVIKLSEFNPADSLQTDKDIAVFLSEAFATGDYKHIAHCLGIVARAKGMTNMAKEADLAREALNAPLSEDGDLTLRDTLALLKALNVSLSVIPAQKAE